MDVVTFYFTPLAAELEDLNGKALDIGLEAPQMIANYTTQMFLKENDEGVKRGEPDKSVWDTDPYYAEEDLDKFSYVEIMTYGQGFRAGYESGILSMMACESYEAAVERTSKQRAFYLKRHEDGDLFMKGFDDSALCMRRAEELMRIAADKGELKQHA